MNEAMRRGMASIQCGRMKAVRFSLMISATGGVSHPHLSHLCQGQVQHKASGAWDQKPRSSECGGLMDKTMTVKWKKCLSS